MSGSGQDEQGVVQLRVLASVDPDDEHEVAIEADVAHTVRDVAEALLGHLGSDLAEPTLLVVSRREVLGPEAQLAAAGIRSGDRLRVVPEGWPQPAETEPSARFLVAVGGPCAGREHPLRSGEYVVGRSSSADVTLNDPFLSRNHFRLSVTDETIHVVDAGSSNSTVLDGEPVEEEPRLVEPGQVLEAGASIFEIREFGTVRTGPSSRHGEVPFNRPPRVTPTGAERSWTLPAPPEATPKNRLPLAASLMPLVIGVGAWLVAGNTTFLMFAALSPVMALVSFFENRRSGGRESREAKEAFEQRLTAIETEAASALATERDRLRALCPDPADLLDRAARATPSLWERSQNDADALTVRVGWGEVPSDFRFSFEHGGEDEALAAAHRRLRAFDVVRAVPVTLSIRDAGTVGITGPEGAVDDLGRWVLAQLATLHSPRDTVLVVGVHPHRAEGWTWATWLPHVTTEVTSVPLPARVALDASATEELLQSLLAITRQRARAQSRTEPSAKDNPAVVVLLDGRLPLRRDDVDELLSDGPDVGIFVLWLGDTVANLPGGCEAVVAIDGDEGTVRLIDAKDGQERWGRGVDGLAVDLADDLGLHLAPIRDVSARGAAGGVPRVAPLLEVLELAEITPEAVAARWRQPRDGVEAVVGASAAGPLTIDLRRDGPHGLVGGTTGSGKSELLQSWIAALAATHPPDRVAFLLVDYKGGAAFKDCVDFTHTVGFVTNLDGALVHRALISLNAELRHREHLLRDADAKDLIEMERRAPELAPPNLLIVVDEFATLAKELPEFVDGVVDVAQRGRSLGVHLVLATQRPSGSINDNIRANTNLRIALRMSDDVESSDVVGAVDAARIPRSFPGRAFVRTGPSELVQFQSAYVGGTTSAEEHSTEVVVQELEHGIPVDTTVTTLVRPVSDLRSDLERLVDAVVGAAEQQGIERPRAPWLPPVPDVLPLASLGAPEDGLAAVGVLDEPDLQRQRVWSYEPDRDGNMLIYGSGGTGKTTFLRTLATSVATSRSVDHVHLYGMDFATRGLAPLEDLPRCGSIIAGSDRERIDRIFRILAKEVDRRRDLFSSGGVGTIEEYRAIGHDLPRLLVLLDNYAGFTAEYEKVDLGAYVDALPRLLSDGRSLGITFVVTAERRAAVPQSLAGAVDTRIVLPMTDPDDYSALGIDPKLTKGARPPAGRAFLGDRILQVAIVGDDPAPEAQLRAIQEMAAGLDGGTRAPEIGYLPQEVSFTDLPTEEGAFRSVLGIGDDELAPVGIDLHEGHFLVVGPRRSGRSTVLATIARGLQAAHPATVVYLMAGRRSPLIDMDGLFRTVAVGADEWSDLAGELDDLVRSRDEDHVEDPPVVVLVDDAQEVADSGAGMALETIVRKGHDTGVRIVAAADPQSALRAYGGILSEVKKDKHGVLLSPDHETDGDVLGVRLPRRATGPYPAGRGYLVDDDGYELIQIAY